MSPLTPSLLFTPPRPVCRFRHKKNGRYAAASLARSSIHSSRRPSPRTLTRHNPLTNRWLVTNRESDIALNEGQVVSQEAGNLPTNKTWSDGVRVRVAPEREAKRIARMEKEAKFLADLEEQRKKKRNGRAEVVRVWNPGRSNAPDTQLMRVVVPEGCEPGHILHLTGK